MISPANLDVGADAFCFPLPEEADGVATPCSAGRGLDDAVGEGGNSRTIAKDPTRAQSLLTWYRLLTSGSIYHTSKLTTHLH